MAGVPPGDGSRMFPNRTVSAPARPPRPRRTISLAPAVFVRVRGAMDRRAARSRTSDTQSTSQTQSESRPSVRTKFPDLVLQIMRRESLGTSEPSNDGKGNIPHIQEEGRKTWEEFDNHAATLDKHLQKFQDAVKELGSSLELTAAARNMRESVSLTSQLFRENAKRLFPLAIAPSLARSNTGYSQRPPRSWPPLVNSPMHAEFRPIHVELNAMADSVEYLRLSLEQFLEFGDSGYLPLLRFEGDLKYWSACLERYEGQFESREVQIYIHDLSRELGTQFEDTSHCLRDIIDSVPTVRLAQKHAMASLQNLATIATFFSAVTATTLQYSFNNNVDRVSKAVNVFWFNSLVFSIASALNSFLVLMWRRASYSSPRLHIPWWLWIWIRQSPTVFLLISVATFLVGLGCFTASSSQAHYTFVIVIISETISAFGLVALLLWLAYDKWVFYRQGKTQLRVFRFPRSLQGKGDDSLPTHQERAPPTSPPPARDPKPNPDPPTPRGSTKKTAPLTLAQKKERARERWHWVFENVVSFLRVGRKERGQELLESRRMDNRDTRLHKLAVSRELGRCEDGADTNDIQFHPQGKALAICRSSLSMRFELESSRMDEFRHHIGGQARQVVWTSSAEYMVTRKNQAIHVCRVSTSLVPQPHFIRDNSRYILGLPSSKANTPPRLLSLEGTRLNKLAIIDISGTQHLVKEFEGIRIQHIDVTPDGTRVLLAVIIPRVDDGQPTKASLVRKLMVFNLDNDEIEHEVPLWHDVQHVTISMNGRWAVVTYKDYPPPQLWLLQTTPVGVRLSCERQFCARERMSIHEFVPGQNIRFSGRAHFVDNDRYILCATADGKIHIWRRDKAHSVHVHGGLTLDKDKPVQITCNRASNDLMFATRSHDGTVRIWKVHDPPAIHIDTTRISNANPLIDTGTTKLVSLSTLSESPQDETPPTMDIDSANFTDHARLETPPRSMPHSEHSRVVDIDSVDSTSPTIPMPLGTLSESPQESPQDGRPARPGVNKTMAGDGAG